MYKRQVINNPSIIKIQDAFDAKFTTGTIAPLIVSGAYPLACWIAWPHSWAATATEVIDVPLYLSLIHICYKYKIRSRINLLLILYKIEKIFYIFKFLITNKYPSSTVISHSSSNITFEIPNGDK